MGREEYIKTHYVLPQVPAPNIEEIMADPKEGDMVCFDGQEWRVARSGGWFYPVPSPEEWHEAGK